MLMDMTATAPARSVTLTSPPAPTVFVVHGDSSLRTSLATLIRGASWRPELFADARTFLSRLRLSGPACLVINTELPDIGGLELQSLLAHRRDIPIIFVADNPSVRTTVRAIKAGAIEVLTKPPDERLLLDAIRQALQRSSTVQSHEAERRALQQKCDLLSRREREVMTHVVRGRLNKHIAAELGISEVTVKVHRGRVMRKMQADSVPDLVNMAMTLQSLASPSGKSVDKLSSCHR
jgi:FixJ family two-component response regulator